MAFRMRPWRVIGLLVVANAGVFACGEGDEHPPMMGDCPTCTSTPAPASNGSNPPGDAGLLDASETLDAQTPPPDALDIVDVGVLAPEAGSDAVDMLPDVLNFAH